jgi:hypothetical protein
MIVKEPIAEGNGTMIDETLKRIENTVQNSQSIQADTRQELLTQLAALKEEVAQLADTHHDQAKSIAGFMEVSAHEATRPARDENLMSLGLDGLGAAVRDFEATHPRLTDAVNTIRQLLANIGVT